MQDITTVSQKVKRCPSMGGNRRQGNQNHLQQSMCLWNKRGFRNSLLWITIFKGWNSRASKVFAILHSSVRQVMRLWCYYYGQHLHKRKITCNSPLPIYLKAKCYLYLNKQLCLLQIGTDVWGLAFQFPLLRLSARECPGSRLKPPLNSIYCVLMSLLGKHWRDNRIYWFCSCQ